MTVHVAAHPCWTTHCVALDAARSIMRCAAAHAGGLAQLLVSRAQRTSVQVRQQLSCGQHACHIHVHLHAWPRPCLQMSTTGFADYVPKSWPEMFIVIVAATLGIVTFGMVVAVITTGLNAAQDSAQKVGAVRPASGTHMHACMQR